MSKVLIIGELGINHNGSVEIAKCLIDVAVLAGVDVVKFQKRDIDSVYTKEFLDSPRQSVWGTTQRAQKEGLELSLGDYHQIDRHCRSTHMGRIIWTASPWDVKSVAFLKDFNVPFYKVASPLVTNHKVLEGIGRTGKPVILSIGMSTYDEILTAVSMLETFGTKNISLLVCTSTYPCRVENLNLKRIETLRHQFPRCTIGYSGHEVGLWMTLCAVAMGAKIVERHITLDRSMVGSDHSSSVEPQGLIRLVKEIRNFEKALGCGDIGPIDDERPLIEKLRGA